MKLSKEELLQKFPAFKKYASSDWLQRLTMKNFGDLNQLPFSLCELLLNDLLSFVETTRFNTCWEESFSTKIRVQQMLDILKNIQHLED